MVNYTAIHRDNPNQSPKRGRSHWWILPLLILVGFGASSALSHAADQDKPKFKRVATQFIAALAPQGASSGVGAETWGIWPVDPGPRGVRLNNYPELTAAGGVAPHNWQFSPSDWWLEENGLIMEPPQFPIPEGRYIVTGDRETVTMLTIHPEDADGVHKWELDQGATLYDVTHLGCRSARYTQPDGEAACSPATADQSAFRVSPGAEMPHVPGCDKQDYAVLFIVGVEDKQ